MSELWQRVEGIMTILQRRQLRVGGLRARTVHGADAADGHRAHKRRSARTHRGWLSTVNDSALRTLDRELLTDLLRDRRWIRCAGGTSPKPSSPRRRPDPRRLLRSGSPVESGADRRRAPVLPSARARVGGDRAVRQGIADEAHAGYLRSAEATLGAVERACVTPSVPAVIVPLAEGLAAEQDARARRRLRDILVGFGPRGAESVRPLMNAGELGGPAYRGVPAARVRRRRGAEGTRPAARRTASRWCSARRCRGWS